MGSVCRTGLEAKKGDNEKGLVDWYAALQEEGIKPAGENGMRQFIVEGLK